MIPLDYERAHEFLLTVQGTDLGIPPLSSQATVNITVLDSNDNAPSFSEISYSAEISEDCNVGDVVTQVCMLNFFSIVSQNVMCLLYILRYKRLDY